MSVRLRIAGIYYDETFEMADLTPVPAFGIPDRLPPANPTIFELLEAAYRRSNTAGVDASDFIYVFERRGNKGLSITSLGVTHEVDIVGSLGGKFRPKGKYQLTETPIPEGVVAWQYYVYRDGVSCSQLKPVPDAGDPLTGFSPAKGGTSFTGFDQFQLEDGDEVIYRMVAILRGPNLPS